MREMSLPLSECAGKYAMAIADPWAPEAEGGCIPTFPSRPSQKTTTFGRFTVTIGTSGFGFAAFAPSLASDGIACYYSKYDYGGTVISSNTTTGVDFAYLSNLPCNISDFVESNPESGNSLSGGRIVSFGASCQYTGTELNRGGLIYSLTEPGHESISSLGAAEFGAYREVSINRVSENKTWITAFGTNATEVSYPDDYRVATLDRIRKVWPFSGGQRSDAADNLGAPIMGFIFTGTVGNTFEVEMVEHIEMIGYKAQAMLTPSHTDSQGFEIIQQAAGNLQNLRTKRPSANLKTLLFDGIREAAGMLRVVGPVVSSAMPIAKVALKNGADPRAVAAAVVTAIASNKAVRQQIAGSLGRIGKPKKGKKRR